MNISQPKKDPKPKRARNWSKLRRNAVDVLNIVSSISDVLIHLKARPKPSDWAAISLKSMNIGFKVYDYYRGETNKDANEFFTSRANDPDGWIQIGTMYSKYICKHISNPQRIPGYGSEQLPIQIATFGNDADAIDISFRGLKADELSTYYVRRRSYDAFLTGLCEFFWNDLGTNFVHVTRTLSHDDSDLSDMLMTPQVDKLQKRVARFNEMGQHRSYLIEGVPGSGKSTAVKLVSKALNMRTMRLDFTALDEQNYSSIRGILTVTRPEIIIVDDIDRTSDKSIPIPLVEEWREKSKIIFVTINHMTKLADAMLRPGRLDDHIKMNFTDESIVRQILGSEDLDLVDRMTKWPIAYVMDYVRRREAFGSEQARSELSSLDPTSRMAIMSDSGPDDGDFGPREVLLPDGVSASEIVTTDAEVEVASL